MTICHAQRIENDDLPYVLVVGGSPEGADDALLMRLAARCSRVVAVDAGLDALLAAGIGCDVFCGDVDSVSGRGARAVRAAEVRSEPFIGEVERYDPHKDFTDLSLALRAIHERWGDVPLLCCRLSGGRPDHALAAIGCALAWKGPVAWEERAYAARILRANDTWDLSGLEGRTFSFVCLSPEGEVSEEGMEWTLEHRRVKLLQDLGISNILRAGARITCHEGVLMAFVMREPA